MDNHGVMRSTLLVMDAVKSHAIGRVRMLWHHAIPTVSIVLRIMVRHGPRQVHHPLRWLEAEHIITGLDVIQRGSVSWPWILIIQ